MLRVKWVSLVQFKNYADRTFRFSGRIIGICGKNGVGKTNLLDALHYVCFTKSYFTRQDQVSVQSGMPGFRLETELEKEGAAEKAVCILRETGKKEFAVNDQPYEKFAGHIGRYPCVIIAPDDINIILDGSEERRRFVDMMLCQLDPGYLENLLGYNKILQQRNSLLKSFAESGKQNLSLLEVLDQQLTGPGHTVFDRRKTFLVEFLPRVKQLYNEIANQYEDINLIYKSQLMEASLEEWIRMNRSKDLRFMRTTAGIHRDDIEFQFDGKPFKTIASQGQRKSLLFALKLAEMEVLQEEKGYPPILLLDDVFEKLDEDRIRNLLQRVCVQNEGQVFITDTNCKRLKDQLAALGTPFEIIEL